MANLCSTKVVVYGDIDELLQLKENIARWELPTSNTHSSEVGWLGNIVENAGIGRFEDGNYTVSCRGELQSTRIVDDVLVIETSTAWAPMIRMWKMICDKYLSTYLISYYAEESGNDLLLTNDEDYVGKYYVDSARDDIESNDCADEQVVVSALQKVLKSEVSDITQLIDILEDGEYDLWLHKWRYADIDELQ